jgi:Rrf2 family transcriptional regulator, nitric oxide-sensitive transcriptional repressor
MKLTAFTDYSLRVLIYVAAQPESRATIAQIATTFDISENHLTKVVHFLGKNGWLANVRGKGGGLELAMPPELIGLGQVVRNTEGIDMPAECFGEGASHCCIAGICRLSGALAEALRAFYSVLDQHTLADLVRNRAALAQVLFTQGNTLPPATRKTV